MRALMWPLLLMSLLVGGCASAPVHTDGLSGSVTWHATHVQLAQATTQGAGRAVGRHVGLDLDFRFNITRRLTCQCRLMRGYRAVTSVE